MNDTTKDDLEGDIFELKERHAKALEAAAKAGYEDFFGSLIGCAEPPWEHLPFDHQLRLMMSTRASIMAYNEAEKS